MDDMDRRLADGCEAISMHEKALGFVTEQDKPNMNESVLAS
jgi:hypothetical protein